MPGNWSTDAVPARHVHDGGDPDCEGCAATDLIAEAGARALATEAGLDFDAFDPHQQLPYKQIATEVCAAMSDAMLELRVAVPTDA